MLRILIQYLLPLLLPFVAYLLYAWLAGRPRILESGPWLSLAVTGLALVVVSLVSWGLLVGSEPGERYVPARMEDGRVVPGMTEPVTPAAEETADPEGPER